MSYIKDINLNYLTHFTIIILITHNFILITCLELVLPLVAMKKLLYIFTILLFISCDKDKDPDPAGESALDKQQAPFGKSEVEVELKKLQDHIICNGLDLVYPTTFH